MEAVEVVYHFEDDCWWSEAPSVMGFYAGGSTFAEARRLTLEGLEFTVGRPVVLDERYDGAALAALRAAATVRVTGGTDVVTSSGQFIAVTPSSRPAEPSVTVGPEAVASSAA